MMLLIATGDMSTHPEVLIPAEEIVGQLLGYRILHHIEASVK